MMRATHDINHHRHTCDIEHVEVRISFVPHCYWHNVLSWRDPKCVVKIKPPCVPEVAACTDIHAS
jgi:hypothetical protein